MSFLTSCVFVILALCLSLLLFPFVYPDLAAQLWERNVGVCPLHWLGPKLLMHQHEACICRYSCPPEDSSYFTPSPPAGHIFTYLPNISTSTGWICTPWDPHLWFQRHISSISMKFIDQFNFLQDEEWKHDDVGIKFIQHCRLYTWLSLSISFVQLKYHTHTNTHSVFL